MKKNDVQNVNFLNKAKALLALYIFFTVIFRSEQLTVLASIDLLVAIRCVLDALIFKVDALK